MPLPGPDENNECLLLLVADEAQGTRLRSDLEYAGYEVAHLILRDDLALPDDAGSFRSDYKIILIEAETDTDGVNHIVQEIRRILSDCEAPVIVSTDERTALELDFSAGVSDFVIRPCSLREMEARLRLSLWNEDRPDDASTIKVEDLVINTARYEVRVKGVPVDLTLKEYELLKHLVTHSGRVFTRADLLDSIWGYDYYGGMRTVDVHIRRLRSKLQHVGESITTLRGVGYRFDRP